MWFYCVKQGCGRHTAKFSCATTVNPPRGGRTRSPSAPSPGARTGDGTCDPEHPRRLGCSGHDDRRPASSSLVGPLIATAVPAVDRRVVPGRSGRPPVGGGPDPTGDPVPRRLRHTASDREPHPGRAGRDRPRTARREACTPSPRPDLAHDGARRARSAHAGGRDQGGRATRTRVIVRRAVTTSPRPFPRPGVPVVGGVCVERPRRVGPVAGVARAHEEPRRCVCRNGSGATASGGDQRAGGANRRRDRSVHRRGGTPSMRTPCSHRSSTPSAAGGGAAGSRRPRCRCAPPTRSTSSGATH